MNTAPHAVPPPARIRVTFLPVVLSLLAAGLFPPVVSAQTATSAVPGFFNFQGKVANANGTLVGASPNPVNRTVIFRIWDHASNSATTNLVYSEQQVVTITDGEFSVLIGQGSAVSGTPLGFSETAKGAPTVTIGSPAVFGGATRYLGITVDDGTGAADPEITPRQQLVTSAYAFRAKYAESVGSNGANALFAADNGYIGVGTSSPGARLEVAGNVAVGGVTNASFVLANADRNTVGTVGTASTAGALSTDSAVNDVVVRADAGKLLLQNGVGASAIAVDTSNKVGVGTTAPGAKLEVKSGDSLNTAFISNTGGGGGTQPALRVKMAAASGARNVIQAENNAGSVFVVRDDGNVGIGTTSPAARLDVNGAIMLNPGFSNNAARPAVGTARVAGEIGAYGSAGTAQDDGFLRLSAGGGTSAGTKSFIDLTGYSTVADMHENIRFGTAGTERMRIDPSGNVGIGTTSPSGTRLYVSSPTATANISQSAVFLATGIGSGTNASHIHYGTLGDIYWRSASTGGKVVLQDTGGMVGIGTSSPSAGRLHVNGTAGSATGNLSYYIDAFGHGGPWGANPYTRSDISVYASNSFVSGSGFFLISSDARIKDIVGVSDGRADLETLSKIKVTDYRYRDVPAMGTGVYKMAIAQQVEQVYPQAVSQRTDVVPDIYKPATITDGWITLATDLKVGDRVRLITEAKTNDLHEVLEVQADRFRTSSPPVGKKVFVYGREVSDFRNVDYDAISMLNVSATQELARENDALKKRVAELEAKDRARDARMASIEKLLQASQTVMASPAKTTTSNNGQE